MKLKVAVNIVYGDEVYPKDLILFVETDAQDQYLVLFDAKKVLCATRENRSVIINSEFMIENGYSCANFKVDEKDLQEKQGMPGVESFLCAVFYVGEGNDQKKMIVEYLEGDVPDHDHGSPNIREVYLAAEGPMKGEICGYGESHKTFCKKTIAVKVIDLM